MALKKKEELRWWKFSYRCEKCETLFQVEFMSSNTVAKVHCPLCLTTEVKKRK
jgi:hypothetical protein